ncbi:hypothetical protein [Bacillus bombysepticus]|uniref:hypothetical protein n=1 Tax=Bacillus bombysepticus TaxID=658666 RepID=UPI00301896FF
MWDLYERKCDALKIVGDLIEKFDVTSVIQLEILADAIKEYAHTHDMQRPIIEQGMPMGPDNEGFHMIVSILGITPEKAEDIEWIACKTQTTKDYVKCVKDVFPRLKLINNNKSDISKAVINVFKDILKSMDYFDVIEPQIAEDLKIMIVARITLINAELSKLMINQ